MNKRAYRKSIEKLTLKELRDALVREAALREAAQSAAFHLQRELMGVSSKLSNDIKKSITAVVRKSQQTMFKPVKVTHG